MLKTAVILYLAAIHLVVAVALIKTDFIDKVKMKLGFRVEQPELSNFYYHMVGYHKRVDGNVPDGAVLCIGDSFIQSLAVTAVSPFAVNYGIGSDTTVGVLERLHVYQSIKRASKIIIAIGGNDLTRRDLDDIIVNYKKILDFMPEHTEIFVNTMHPVDETCHHSEGRTNERIARLNSKLNVLCKNYSNVTCFEIADQLQDKMSGNLLARYHVGDGLHLSQAGYQIWIDEMSKLIGSQGKRNWTSL
jgi:lysophospholipase L1-like esterase